MNMQAIQMSVSVNRAGQAVGFTLSEDEEDEDEWVVRPVFDLDDEHGLDIHPHERGEIFERESDEED